MTDKPWDEEPIIQLTRLTAKVDELTREIIRLEQQLGKLEYVSQDEFKPVKAIAYGLVALILVAVMGSIMTLVTISRNAPVTAVPK